jgi:hypothetical protein
MGLPEESVLSVCPNPKCKREIDEPILLTNLSFNPVEQYTACPYCFTKLEPDTPDDQQEVIPLESAISERDEEPNSPLIKKVEEIILASNEPREKKNETGCPENFGYLADRPKDTPVPQECMLCPKMVDCMLKTKE